jgi:tetratricopeptide (TPR) repeat protein
MKRPLLLLTSYFLLLTSFAQSYDPTKVNKKTQQLYEQAITRAQEGNYANAVGLLKQCIEQDNKYVDAYLSLAGVFGQLKSYQESVNYYEKAFAMDSVYSNEYKLPYSINLAGLGNFDKALSAIQSLLSSPKLNVNTKKAAEFRKLSYY